jgi:hypothetical protein
MKKTLILSLVGILVLSMGVFSFADTGISPLELLENLTGTEVLKSTEETYGDLAREYGVYDEFHAAFLTNKLDLLQAKVASGELSQEAYDELVVELENCDGTGTSKMLSNLGMRFGNSEAKGNRNNANGDYNYSQHRGGNKN